MIMPRKLPFRNANEITQSYNDGVVRIYAVSDAADPGYQIKEALSLKRKMPYEEQRLGINRLYLSRQNQAEVTRVIRVQRTDISNQDIAITQDGKQYRIDTVQTVQGVSPASLDLSLRAVEQNFEVMPE